MAELETLIPSIVTLLVTIITIIFSNKRTLKKSMIALNSTATELGSNLRCASDEIIKTRRLLEPKPELPKDWTISLGTAVSLEDESKFLSYGLNTPNKYVLEFALSKLTDLVWETKIRKYGDGGSYIEILAPKARGPELYKVLKEIFEDRLIVAKGMGASVGLDSISEINDLKLTIEEVKEKARTLQIIINEKEEEIERKAIRIKDLESKCEFYKNKLDSIKIDAEV